MDYFTYGLNILINKIFLDLKISYNGIHFKHTNFLGLIKDFYLL